MSAVVRHWPIIGLILALCIGVLVLSAGLGFGDPVTLGLIYGVLVVGLYTFSGQSGVLSFGHVAFMAVGAYTSALLTIPVATKAFVLPDLPGFLASTELPVLVGLCAAALVAGTFGYLVGIPLMRLQGIAASIATLSLLVIVQVVLKNLRLVGAGAGTVTGVPTETDTTLALLSLAGCVLLAYIFQVSVSGTRLRAAREDELAARAVGVSVERERRRAFALSAAIVGVGGALYGHFLGSFSPDAFYLSITFLMVAMLVVGGMRSLLGAVLGVAVVSALTELFNEFEVGVVVGGIDVSLPPGTREVVIALLLLAMLRWRPDGLAGNRELSWPRRSRAVAVDSGEVGAPPSVRPRRSSGEL